jgi:hypothetical protein
MCLIKGAFFGEKNFKISWNFDCLGVFGVLVGSELNWE